MVKFGKIEIGNVEALRKRSLAKKYSAMENCVCDLFQVLNLKSWCMFLNKSCTQCVCDMNILEQLSLQLF